MVFNSRIVLMLRWPILSNSIIIINYRYQQAGKPKGEAKYIGKTALHNPKIKFK